MTSEEVSGTEKGIDNKLVFLYKTEERKLSHFHADQTPHHSHIQSEQQEKATMSVRGSVERLGECGSLPGASSLRPGPCALMC